MPFLFIRISNHVPTTEQKVKVKNPTRSSKMENVVEATPTVEPTTTEQPTKVEETKTEKVEEVQVETPKDEKAEDVFDLSDIEQVDGEFVLTIDKDDPESTVYKGKTPDDVLKAAKKGLLEKDKYIRQLKSKELDASITHKAVEKSDELVVERPNDNLILSQTLKEMNIPEEMVNWTKEQWKEYEATEGAVFTLEARQALKDARLVAQERSDVLNIDYINDLQLKNEHKRCIKMMEKADVYLTKEQYDEVLSEIHKNNKNPEYWEKNGIRINGAIVGAVAERILELKTQKVSQKVSKEKDEEVAKSRVASDKVVSIPATKKEQEKARPNPKTLDSTREDLIKAMK